MLSSTVRAYVCTEPTDMRKAIDGLVQLIEPAFKADPFSGHMFVFLGKSRNKAKIIVWDRTGFWLLYNASRATSFQSLTNWPRVACHGLN